MKSLQIYLIGMVVLFIMAGCAPATPEQPADNVQNTDIPLITLTPTLAASGLTNTVTPIPPPTHRPTFTEDPNITPTITPLPSFTRVPPSKYTKTVTPTVTGTNTLYVRPKYSWITGSPTPKSYNCAGEIITPAWGKVLKPRENFIAKWRVVNNGTNLWHVDDILFGFVSGTRMQNDGREDVYLTDTLSINSVISLQVQLVPPTTPGVYTAYWGLRKSNKKEFFCSFSVTIEVRK